SGGRLAHEMANQLLAMGKQIVSLVIIDTGVEELEVIQDKLPKSVKRLKRELNRIKFTVNAYLNYPKPIFNFHLKEIKKRARKLMSVNKTENEALFKVRKTDIFDAHYSVFTNSKLTKIDVKIDLLKAT